MPNHKLLQDARNRIVLVNASVENNNLTAGYFYCVSKLPAGDYELINPLTGSKVKVKLPEQAVNLPGIGQQFNYPFEVIEE